MKINWSKIPFRNKIFICLLLIVFLLSSICLVLSQYIHKVSEISNELIESQVPEFLWINHWASTISTKIGFLETLKENQQYELIELLYATKAYDIEYVQLYSEVPSTLLFLKERIDSTEYLYRNKISDLILQRNIEVAERLIYDELLPSLRAIEEEIQDSHQHVTRMLKSQSQEMRNMVNYALWTLFIGAGVAIILSLYFSYRISLDLTRPIHQVIQYVEDISKGNYGLQLPGSSQIELEKLVSSINQMSVSLFQSFDKLYKEKLFREKVMASIPVGIVTVNNEINEIQVNETAKQIVELNEKTWSNILYGGKVCKRNTEFWAWFQSKEFFLMRKTTIRNRNSTVKVIVSQTPLTDQNEEQIGRIFYFVDISKLDALEQRIYRSEKLALVGELAAGSAHEIRNPLSVIHGFIQIINSSVDEEQRRRFQLPLVLKELDRINNIVENMLLLAKPGAPNLRMVSFTQEVLEGIMPLIYGSCPESIHINLEIEPFEIIVDPEQMKQVFYNMIRNSIEAIEGAGEIYIYNEITAQQVCIYFKDTGKGISFHKHKEIFEPFISTKESGTGLGLTIIQRIVENHHGEIELVETSSNGTIFKMTLPL